MPGAQQQTQTPPDAGPSSPPRRRAFRWTPAAPGAALGVALGVVLGVTLGAAPARAQAARRDSAVSTTAGRGATTYVLLSGLAGGVAGYRRLDAETQRAYTEPMLQRLSAVVAMAGRLAGAQEPEALAGVVARVRVPVTVILGDAPHPAAPHADEVALLAPLGALVRVERLPGVGHFPHEEAPAAVAQFLLAGRPQ